MPAHIAKEIADQCDKTEKQVAKILKKAKKQVDAAIKTGKIDFEEGSLKYWSLITGQVKDYLGIEDKQLAEQIQKKFLGISVTEASKKNKEWKDGTNYVECPKCGKTMKSPKGSYIPYPGTKCPKCGTKMKKKKKG